MDDTGSWDGAFVLTVRDLLKNIDVKIAYDIADKKNTKKYKKT